MRRASPRVGVFGGTFDPIHLGHLRVARSLRSTLELGRVVVVPAGQPWLKAGTEVSPAADRVEMVRLAIGRRKDLELSTIDAERPGPSYAVDTMEALQGPPGAGLDLFFLLGSDALADIARWKEPQRLIRLCRLVAFARPGSRLPDMDALEAAVPGISRRVGFVLVPQVDIRATDIRRRVAEGRSIRGLVPRSVERYIRERGLYRGAPGRPAT
jgi:nicotinate-nucleotide adenylyltransferase